MSPIGAISLIGYLIAGDISQKLQDRVAAALIDPFGSIAMDQVTRYWTIADKNLRMVTLEGVLLWNRLLWIAIAGAMLAYTFARFKFVYALEARRAKPARETGVPETTVAVATPKVEQNFATGNAIRALLRLTRLGFFETVKNIYYI